MDNQQSVKAPTCPMHKRELIPVTFRSTDTSQIHFSGPGFECPAPGCRIKYADAIAADADGFFTLDEDGKPIPLNRATSK